MMKTTARCLVLVGLAAAPAAARGQVAPPPSPSAARAPVLEAAEVRSFLPDLRFDGRDLEGWRVGEGQWRATEGEFVGTPPPAGAGWLLLEDRRQDLAFTASFRCDGGCRTGVLLRGERMGDRIHGAVFSFAPGEIGAYRVVLGPGGRELERERLAPPPSPYPQSMLAFRNEFPGLGNFSQAQMGARRAVGALRQDDWNHVEIYVSGNSARAVLNGGGAGEFDLSGVAPSAHGALGLYVAGASGSRVRFRQVGILDLDEKGALPREVVSPRYRKRHLESMFYSEAITAADVNQDGHMDVISGPFVFLGPDFLTRREIFIPRVYIATSYPDPLLATAFDWTGDGYPDILYGGEPGRPGVLYVNPGREVRRWDGYPVIASIDNEVAFADDIDGDGIPEYIYGDGGYVGYAKPGGDPTQPWTFHPVSEQGPWGAMYAHGLGTGDINGNGRKDILSAHGWWEQPEVLTGAPWTYHPVEFGRWGPQQGGGGGARMYVYDVNGDGLNDVVTSLEAHGWGLAWFEQKRSPDGRITFERHMIMDDVTHPIEGVTFAALHALALADIDGDGLLDIVTGKRWWGHFGENPSDPDAWAPPVVYAFRLTRDGGRVHFVPELIHNHSGVGTDMTVVDLNDDGIPDVMTATRLGTFIFLSQPGGAQSGEE